MRHQQPSTLSAVVRRTFTGFVLASGLSLLAIGIPRFMTELALVPGNAVLARINKGKTVKKDELQILEQSRLSAMDIVDLPRMHTDLGMAYLIRARQATTLPERQKYALMALDAANASLDRLPSNPFAWMQVSLAQAMLGAQHYDAAVKAWDKSIAVAPFEPDLLLQRIHTGILLYGHLSKDERLTLKRQIEMMYHWRYWELRIYAQRHNLVMWIALVCGPDSEVTKFLSKL